MEKPIWGRTDVLGKSVRLNGRLYSVIGVLPPGMAFLEGPDVAFVPLSLVKLREDRGHWHSFDARARLKPGVSIAQGQAAGQVVRASGRGDAAHRLAEGSLFPVHGQALQEKTAAQGNCRDRQITVGMASFCTPPRIHTGERLLK